MILNDFDKLIDEYSVDFTLLTYSEDSKGSYVGGKYVEGEATEAACRGAIIPYADSKIYHSGGTLTTNDRQLIMKTVIPFPLKGAKVRYKGDVYSIEQSTDYGDYASVYIYALKWVSRFDRLQTE